MNHTGRRYLVCGVLNAESLAYRVALGLQEAGAEILLTSFGRPMRLTQRVAQRLPTPAEVLELDATQPEHYAALAGEVGRRWDHLDGIVHAIGGAPEDAREGHFLDAPPESAEAAFRVSAWSFSALAHALRPLLRESPRGASLVSLDFDASRAWPGYDWVGPAKAALESISRYLAAYLGHEGIRVNLVSPGPLETVSGRSHSFLPGVIERWERDAPLGWDSRDLDIAVGPVLFLLSDLARGVSGEIVHVDGGYHVSGGPVPPEWRG